MSALPSPEEYPTSLLSEDSRILIQRSMEDWLFSSGLEMNTDSLTILRSGINQILALIDACIPASHVAEMAYESLGMGDGSVDLVQLAAQITKRMAQDVCTELKANLPSC